MQGTLKEELIGVSSDYPGTGVKQKDGRNYTDRMSELYIRASFWIQFIIPESIPLLHQKMLIKRR